jgi:hypothetical protein
MVSDLIYSVANRFYRAIMILTGPGSQRERLVDAYADQLSAIRPEMLPEAMRYRFSSFRETLSGAEGLLSTVARLSDDEVINIVNLFCTLYDELQTALSPSGHPHFVGIRSDQHPRPRAHPKDR